jgi:C-terminal processing protease CtpA/Prc/Tol biopolymer transport system component
MIKRFLLIAVVLVSVLMAFAFEPHFIKDPDISPNGEEVCFVYDGDLWTVPFEGGQAVRLTNTYYKEYEPKYSPDGKTIAFIANGEGVTQIYTMPAKGGKATKISVSGYGLYDWFPNGKALLGGKYTSRLGVGFYKISLNDKRPEEITLKGNSFAAVSNDASNIVYCERGKPYREAYTGSVNGELWKYDIRKDKYTKLTNSDLTERYPVYSKTNKNRLYYAKSDGQVFQLFRTDNFDFANEVKLTDFPTWSVRDLSIARDNDNIVFEKFDELWAYDGSLARKINVDINEEIVRETMVRNQVVDGFDDIEISSDDQVLLFTYKYDLFMMPANGGPVRQITFDHVPMGRISILEDNKTVVFIRRDKGLGQLYKFTIDNIDELELISWSKDRNIEDFSRTGTGKYVINYIVNDNEIKKVITDENFSTFEPLKVTDKIMYSYKERENSKYAAFVDYDVDTQIFYLNLLNTVSGKKYVLHDSYRSIYSLAWGKDDRSLFFSEAGTVKRVDLHAVDKLADYEDPWNAILATNEDDEEDSPEDTEISEYPELKINFNDFDKRVYNIYNDGGYSSVISVLNDTTIVVGKNGRDLTFYTMNYYGNNKDKITTISDKSYYTYNDNSKNYYYNDGRNVKMVNLETARTEDINNSFFYEYDVRDIRTQLFKEVWGQFGSSFYDPDMHGVDWDKAYAKYFPYVQYCSDENDLSTIVDEMIGEVNASHTGFYPHQHNKTFYYEGAYIGAELDFSERLSKGIKFRRLYDNTSLKDVYGVEAGDKLLAVDGIKITKNTDINKLFFNKLKRKIKLTIKRDGQDKQDIWVKGLSWRQNATLEYRDWVNSRAAIVKKDSDNQVAYLHIRGMNQTALRKFMSDFWSDNLNKKGLIIDVRGNGGGNISDDLIDIIERRNRAVKSSRYNGAKKIQAPFREFDKPIVVLIDEDSFSDAEVFPHLMKDMQLATIIGMPTSGSVIGTNDIDLFDGSSLRLPGHGWWLKDGTNMEGNGAQPHIRVEMSPEDYINDNDLQLERAIDFILER